MGPDQLATLNTIPITFEFKEISVVWFLFGPADVEESQDPNAVSIQEITPKKVTVFSG